MELSVLGPAGTFTDLAAKTYINKQIGQEITIDYFNSFDAVFNSVTDDNLGLLPLENQLDGFVLATLEKLKQHPISILDEIEVAVNFGMVAQAAKKSDIKRLFVQFKTEGQCTRLINRFKDVEIVTTSSNIQSLNKAVNGNFGDAAIVPETEVNQSGLSYKVHNVGDQKDNHTRFIVFNRLKPQVIQLTTQFKASLYITPPDDGPGTLYNILGYFVKYGLNLISLISEPTKEKIGVYSFCIEVSGQPEQQADLLTVITELAEKSSVHFLGFYAFNRKEREL
ncbi:prephenate dehydratase [Secundilactobacillus malefermentans]|uniref:prephenate dehydratase n=1 Tax=Secundilactobacillus malefermentans TaxID=176292 RepID=UPI0011C81C9E|nr:prephenate dehydratase domain-containing protein [Secundilactobacillus malefermentans]QEA32102.1 prephenate dehydratase [Secundilactobacillus malefermentans]